jgi:hypothetical protein
MAIMEELTRLAGTQLGAGAIALLSDAIHWTMYSTRPLGKTRLSSSLPICEHVIDWRVHSNLLDRALLCSEELLDQLICLGILRLVELALHSLLHFLTHRPGA